MFFTKGLHGFILYPNRAILEISAQLCHRTAEPRTLLGRDHLDLGHPDEAGREFDQVLALEADHLAAVVQRAFDWVSVAEPVKE